MNIVQPGKIKGTLSAPSSKSMMQRVVALSVLADGPTTIKNPSLCDDGVASLEMAKGLGARVSINSDTTVIAPKVFPVQTLLECRESGTAMRIFSSLCATFSESITLNGSGTLTSRPMDMIAPTFRELGVAFHTSNGTPPIQIQGPLHGGSVTLDGSITSQFLSGLLIALPICKEDSKIRTVKLKSTPYISMTLDAIREFGGSITWNTEENSFLIPGRQRYTGITTTVEGDWSGASFPLVAGAIAGEITIYNLSNSSLQADRAILNALMRAGATVVQKDSCVTVTSQELSSFEFDATDCPDLFPPLAALASGCRGTSKIAGVSRLLHKESNRANALESEFGKMGLSVRAEGDHLYVTGGIPHEITVHYHYDHRIAMACTIAALRSSGPVKIEHPECVSKSYPSFFIDLESVWSNT